MSLSRPLVRPAKDERGMTTAEYAVGTVATVTFAGQSTVPASTSMVKRSLG